MKIVITAKHLLNSKTELDMISSFGAVGLRLADDSTVAGLGYRPDYTRMFHVPSIIDYAAIGEKHTERFHGILAVFNSDGRPEFLDLIQVTSIDRMSHPHAPSFVRGNPTSHYVVMCIGAYGQVFRRALAAEEYVVLAHLLVQCVSQLNEESMFSSSPRPKQCTGCGNTTYQNLLTVLEDRTVICSECDYVFLDRSYDGRRLRSPSIDYIEPRQPLWTPIDWRQQDGSSNGG